MSERTMQALRDRINARLQTSAISRDRASAAGREVVARCRQSDVETLEWVLSEIDAVLATPEPGIALLRTPSGEGEALNADAILAQLLAIRAQVDATVVMLAGGVGECPHPIDSRTDLSEMGGPERFHCHECDRIIEIDEEVDNEGA